MSNIVGECGKHPGFNFVNCPMCEMDKQEKMIDDIRAKGGLFPGIDKYGACPYCQASWDGGDMLEVLSKMDVFVSKSSTDIKNIAAYYGWTPENKARFSKVQIHEVKLPLLIFTFYQCPSCMYVFESSTGKGYNSIIQAKSSFLDEEEEEI